MGEAMKSYSRQKDGGKWRREYAVYDDHSDYRVLETEWSERFCQTRKGRWRKRTKNGVEGSMNWAQEMLVRSVVQESPAAAYARHLRRIQWDSRLDGQTQACRMKNCAMVPKRKQVGNLADFR
jgi:hypothetical protein